MILRGLGVFATREQVYAEHRSDIRWVVTVHVCHVVICHYCSRFVQYNQLSQDLAFDSRLVETIQQLARAANITGDAEQVTNQRAAGGNLVWSGHCQSYAESGE